MSEAAKSVEETIAELEKAVKYYKKRIDELSGENIKGEYRISGLRKEIKQKRSAFALISQLQLSFGKITSIDEIYATTADAISQTLDTDRVLILTPNNQDNFYTPTVWRGSEGLTEEQSAGLSSVSLEFPAEISKDAGQFLLVNRETQPTEIMKKISEALVLPFFACTPIIADDKALGILMIGRLKEAGTAIPPLDNGDVETLASISGLLSSIVQNMRVGVLQEMDRLKTEFFANLSHEFRTPITLTLGAVDGIMTGRFGVIDNPQVITQAELIKGNQSRLLNLINQILDLEKLESGKVTLKVQRVKNINSFFQKRLEQFSTLTEKKGVKVIYKGDEKLESSSVYLDPERFDRMVFNLLSNAVKFTLKGSITLETFCDDKNYGFRVIDTGIGIKASQLPHIFDRFRQADGSTSREYAGTGIGLSLVKSIAELHSGKLDVRSQYGSGTTFEIIFPLGSAHFQQNDVIEEVYSESDAAAGHISQAIEIKEGKITDQDRANVEQWNEAIAASPRPHLGRVLYVDDNHDLRNYVRDLLKDEVDVVIGYDGRDGLNKAVKYQPDVIVSDLMMPVMNGEQFLEAVKESNELRDIPFVLLTARSGMESKLAGLAKGADDYLNKPFSEAELKARIKNLITIRKQAKQINGELIAARGIQRALLPDLNVTKSKVPENFSFDVLYKPCDILSGDFYDVIANKERAYFYVADVTGHGTASAQVTYVVKSLVNTILESTSYKASAKELIETVHVKYQKYKLEFAVGIVLGVCDFASGTVTLVSTGAPPALHKSIDTVKAVAPNSGPYMCSDTEDTGPVSYDELQLKLAPGESLSFVSDGCFEFKSATSATEWGLLRLTKALKAVSDSNWKDELLEKMVAANGRSKFDDDLTVLRISRTGG